MQLISSARTRRSIRRTAEKHIAAEIISRESQFDRRKLRAVALKKRYIPARIISQMAFSFFIAGDMRIKCVYIYLISRTKRSNALRNNTGAVKPCDYRFSNF